MSNSLLEYTPSASTRAKRFAIQIPVRYRKPRTSTWLEGTTKNISYSGVLFRAECLLEPKTSVELRFDLPAAILGEAPGKIFGKGVVVRVERSPIAGIPPALAVSVSGYRMTRA
jgi:hypothetical protein